MSSNNPTDLTSVGNDGYVSAGDVMFLRRNVFADGVVSAKELDALFLLGEKAEQGDREWPQYFSEAAADFYLREEEPHGYLTQEEFVSLKGRVTRDGTKASTLELGLLIRLLETATKTPEEMTEFVGEQIKRHVLEKDGGAVIATSDVDFIRRYIFAVGGDRNVAVTRAEAELLFDLSDATAKADNDSAWAELFKKAVSNHLMAHIGYNPLGRREALRTHDAIAYDRRGSSNDGFFSRIKNLLADPAKKVEERHRRNNEANEQLAAQAEIITEGEADWIADRIGRDGKLHPSEQALLSYMVDDLEADLPPKLKALSGKAA